MPLSLSSSCAPDEAKTEGGEQTVERVIDFAALNCILDVLPLARLELPAPLVRTSTRSEYLYMYQR